MIAPHKSLQEVRTSELKTDQEVYSGITTLIKYIQDLIWSHSDTLALSMSPNKIIRTYAFCALGYHQEDDNTLRWIVGRNTELSAPAGTQCCERSALSEFFNHGHVPSQLRYFILMGFAEKTIERVISTVEHQQLSSAMPGEWVSKFLLPCGVCREEMNKLVNKDIPFTVWSVAGVDLESILSSYRSEDNDAGRDGDGCVAGPMTPM
eukprot:PhF_6_TR13164/c1_g1_i2/m.20754